MTHPKREFRDKQEQALRVVLYQIKRLGDYPFSEAGVSMIIDAVENPDCYLKGGE